MLGRGYLAEGNPEMIRIVERVHQILVEWMNVLQSREAIENGQELFTESLLRKFHLSGIKCSYATNFKPRADLRGKSSLRSTKDNIEKLLASGYRLDLILKKHQQMRSRNGKRIRLALR